ncbi:hypothetical protein niasHT_007854 [Heterodera trifolii]|uniref:Uncharacterized protein n=1 Tax=Heterodera trifolii TaxID=157864 RepID=A0ABD2LZ82_9BILA
MPFCAEFAPFLWHFFCRCPLRQIVLSALFVLCHFSFASSSFHISPSKMAPLPAEFFGPMGRRPSKHSFRRHHRMKVSRDYWPFGENLKRREICEGRRLSPLVQNALVGLLLGDETAEMPNDSVDLLQMTALPLRMAQNDPLNAADQPAINQCPGANESEYFGEIMPGMPIELRSLCRFVSVENVDEKRLPKRFTEVKCLCDRPNRSVGIDAMRCEPLQFEVPVLLFDDKCEQFRPTLQRITVACLTVWTTAATTKVKAQMGRAERTEFVSVR